MSYTAAEDAEKRLNRYQRLKKEARNSVDHIKQIETQFQSLHTDSVDATEKDEVEALRTLYVDNVKSELGIE